MKVRNTTRRKRVRTANHKRSLSHLLPTRRQAQPSQADMSIVGNASECGCTNTNNNR